MINTAMKNQTKRTRKIKGGKNFTGQCYINVILYRHSAPHLVSKWHPKLIRNEARGQPAKVTDPVHSRKMKKGGWD